MASPAALSTNPLRRIAYELRAERAASAPLPPGGLSFSMARTQAFQRNPLPMLLEAQREHGPVFTLRLLHAPNIFMLGPEANHYMTVSHAANFRWRDGGLGDLAPLLGDGLLTIDGAYHRRARQAMLPAFHRERVAAAADLMVEEARRAVAPWAPGQRVDVYRWARAVALRIAMRALFGLDPDRATRRRRRGRRVRAGPVLLLARLPAADAARPAHPVGAHGSGAPAPGLGALRRDRRAARGPGRARARTS